MYKQKPFWLALERTSIHAGTWLFAPIAGIAVGVLAYFGGIQMTFFPWMPEGILRAALDTAVCVLIAYMLLFLIWFIWFNIRDWATKRLNPWLVITFIGVAITIGGISAYFWDQSRGPILWNWKWQTNWIGYSYSSASPIIYFDGFQIQGINRWDDPVRIDDAYVRSDITDQRIKLHLRIAQKRHGILLGWKNESTNVIPAAQQFMLSGTLPLLEVDEKRSGRMTTTEFRIKFGRFTVFLNGKAVKHFYEKDLDSYIDHINEERKASGS